MRLSSTLMSLAVLALLLSSTFAPSALAELKWEEDGWLTTELADDRLYLGDEFGCYNMVHVTWNVDPGATAIECREYIESRIDASIWGENVLSAYSPSSMVMTDHEIVARQGITVHGDNNGMSVSAWHNAEDRPVDDWDWYNLGRRGGSLEKSIADLDSLKAEIAAGGLVNMYWIGRVNDATIRHDSDVLEYLNNDAEVWLTTWGVAWSYWTVHNCYEFTRSIEEVDGVSVITFESIIAESCAATQPEAWNVPITWVFDLEGANVAGVDTEGGAFEDITGVRNTRQGYSQLAGEFLHLSVQNGVEVKITLDSSIDDYDVMGRSEFFNNFSAAVTIAAHETTDLFKWSSRFTDETNVRFTWLLEPRTATPDAPWIPYAVMGITLSTIVGMMVLLGREGIGPLASRFGAKKEVQGSLPSSEDLRSLDD